MIGGAETKRVRLSCGHVRDLFRPTVGVRVPCFKCPATAGGTLYAQRLVKAVA